MLSYILFLFLTIIIVNNPQFIESKNLINVAKFGARGDGKTDSTGAFFGAWSTACRSINPATVYVLHGEFVIKTIVFTGPCKSKIGFKVDGTLVTPSGYGDWNSGSWIMFYKVNELSVSGGGSIDAKRRGFSHCSNKNSNNCPGGPKSMTIMWCENVIVSGLTSKNSRLIHIAVDNCKNLRIQNVQIKSPSGSPNTDGIHVESSSGVAIVGCAIKTGDDCISIGPGSFNLWISHIACGPGHGISIGSLGNGYNEDGVQNITVTNSIFTKTQNGVRLKTWARPSTGYARNIVFRNLIMKGVGSPILIDQEYCPHNRCPQQTSGVSISHITYKNIKGTSSSDVAVRFKCSSTNPCRGIKMQDIKLTFLNPLELPTVSYCENAKGTHTGFVFPKSCVS